MGLSRGYEMATDPEFRGLSNFATPVRAGRITAIEVSGQVRVESDDPEGGDVLAWPLDGAVYAVGDVVYVDFAVNNPESAIVVGSKSSVPRVDGGLSGARVYNSANISLANATGTVLTFNSERFDTDAYHSTSSNTGRLTATVAGVYMISAHVVFDVNTTGIRSLALRVSGVTTIAYDARQPLTGGAATAISLSTVVELTAGQYVEVVAYQDSGGALNVLFAGNYTPEFAIARLGSR